MKIAYSNCGGDEDTLIVRDLNSGKQFDRFGVNGISQIRHAFYTILDVLKAQKTMGLKYFEDDELCSLLGGFSDIDGDDMCRGHEDNCSSSELMIKWDIEMTKLQTCSLLKLVYMHNLFLSVKNKHTNKTKKCYI